MFTLHLPEVRSVSPVGNSLSHLTSDQPFLLHVLLFSPRFHLFAYPQIESPSPAHSYQVAFAPHILTGLLPSSLAPHAQWPPLLFHRETKVSPMGPLPFDQALFLP